MLSSVGGGTALYTFTTRSSSHSSIYTLHPTSEQCRNTSLLFAVFTDAAYLILQSAALWRKWEDNIISVTHATKTSFSTLHCVYTVWCDFCVAFLMLCVLSRHPSIGNAVSSTTDNILYFYFLLICSFLCFSLWFGPASFRCVQCYVLTVSELA